MVHGLKRLLPLMMLLACGGDSGAPPAAAPVDTPVVPTPAAAPSILDRVPPDVLVRGGACPFECCVYGEWRADTVIPVRSGPRHSDDVVFTLAAGEWFRADSGFVQVVQPSYVVVSDSIRGHNSDGPFTFAPGDTVVLLDYIGEGYWNLWHDDTVVAEVAQFWLSQHVQGTQATHGEQFGEYRREWWVRAVNSAGSSGWLAADSARFSGADACGGPVER